MDRNTGRVLSGDAHLGQSIGDILSTPIGSRRLPVPDYGSALFALLDGPMNALGRLRIIAATADAIRRWEPRIRLTRVQLTGDASGQFAVHLQGRRTDDPDPTSLTILTIPLALPV